MTDLRQASRQVRRAAARYARAEAKNWPTLLVPAEIPSRPASMKGEMPVEVWRSSRFLLQVYPVSPVIERLSVNRAVVARDGNWGADISWEELQALKQQCGRGHLDAVEIYPAQDDVVNVANMRHLWVFKTGKLPFAWRTSRSAPNGDSLSSS
jgi:hypothetical protein